MAMSHDILKYICDYLNMHCDSYITALREPEKIDNTEIKTGIGPPLPPPNLHTGPHLTNLGGGGPEPPPPPPLDPRM